MKKKKKRGSRIERILYRFCILLLVLLPVSILVSKAMLSSINMDVEVLKNKVNKQKNANEALEMKVNELKSLANIDAVSESEGLSYNSSNIKVIDGN